MKTYTFLKGRQDNKWCSLKNFDFSNRTKKMGQREYYRIVVGCELWHGFEEFRGVLGADITNKKYWERERS